MRNRLPLSRKHQRGAILIMTAAFIVAAVALLALAVDTGRLYAAQQKLQSAANQAALETARYVGGCRELTGADNTLFKQANTAVGRSYDSDAPTIAGSDFGTGVVETNDGLREFADTPVGTHPTAVRLTAEDANYKPLFTGLFGETKPLRASAGAVNQPLAKISIGSQLFHFEPKFLEDLLGLNLEALKNGELADTSISLAQLLGIDAGVATREQLLETSVNQALTNIGDISSGQVAQALGDISNLLPAHPDQASLADILDIAGDVGSDLSVNAGAIVNAAAQLAAIKRDKTITKTINQRLGIVGGATATLRLLEPPQITIGPPGIDPHGSSQDDFPAYYTQVESAQVGLEIVLNLLDIDLGLIRANLLNLPLAVRGARATLGIKNIDCARAGQRFHTVSLDAQTEDLRVGVGSFNDINGNGRRNFQPSTAKILEARLLFLPLPALVELSADAPVGVDSEVPNLDPIRDIDSDLPQTRELGDAIDTAFILNALSGLDFETNVVGLPIPLNDILNPISNFLSGPLTTGLSPILDPILEGLNISLGTGDAQLIDLDVDQTKLFCTDTTSCFPDAG